MTWTPEMTTAVGTLAGAFIGALFGILGTWLGLKHQYRIKSLELGSMARLRAKELLCKTYQDRIVHIQRRAGELQGALGTTVALYKTIEDENERKQVNEGLMMLLQQVYEFRREWFEELKEERRKVGLENSSPVQMAAIEKSLEMDVFDIKSQEELSQMIVNIVKMIAASDNLWQDVLVKKSEDLFEQEAKLALT
jgi:hypothetical protein